MPGHSKSGNITLKRGVLKNGSDFYKWLSAARFSSAERRDFVVSLLDENRLPVKTWKVRNAFPVEVEGPQLKAAGNEVAIESVEIAHEGMELQNGG